MRRLLLAAAVALAPCLAQAGAADWVGRYGYDLVTSPDWQDSLQALTGAADLERLRAAFGISEPVTQQGDWVIATGCAPHECGFVMGGVAISVSSGKVMAVLKDDGGVTVWGGAAADLPPPLAEIAGP